MNKTTLTIIDLKHSPWNGYTGQSVGRVIHYLYHYVGINIADSSQISSTHVVYHGKTIADIDWSRGFPYFHWRENELSVNQRTAAYQNQNAMVVAQEAIEPLLDDFERVMNKALDYAEKDKVFLHNKNCLMDIKKKYFKDE